MTGRGALTLAEAIDPFCGTFLADTSRLSTPSYSRYRCPIPPQIISGLGPAKLLQTKKARGSINGPDLLCRVTPLCCTHPDSAASSAPQREEVDDIKESYCHPYSPCGKRVARGLPPFQRNQRLSVRLLLA